MKEYLTTKEKEDIKLEEVARNRLSPKDFKKIIKEENKELKRHEVK